MAKLLEPQHKTRVKESRPSLKSIPFHMISYDSYGDIWGESKPPTSQDSTTALVPDDDEKSDLLNGEAAIPTKTGNSEEKPARRWVAEPREGDETEEDDDQDYQKQGEVIVKLTDLAEADGEPSKPRKMKRRGSNDLIPVVPSRRGSVFGAKRQSSFKYKELSQKGTSIEMNKCPEGNKDDQDSEV